MPPLLPSSMAMLNMNLISLFFLKLLFVGLSAPQFIAGDDSQRFVYSGFANASLNLDGTASVTPGGLLELTNGTAMSMGHAFYPAPLRLHDSPNGTVQSFSASFVFGIISIYDLRSHVGRTEQGFLQGNTGTVPGPYQWLIATIEELGGDPNEGVDVASSSFLR